MSDFLKEIVKVEFPPEQYFNVDMPKKQIVLHHTVSGEGVEGDISWWLQTADRIATCIIIARDGKIYQCFGSKKWAHHLGITSTFLKTRGYADAGTRNNLLNQQSIGVELDSWGGLAQKADGKWYNAVWNNTTKRFEGGKSRVDNVQEYPNGFRGFKAFEKYTPLQLEALKKLLLYWKSVYTDIPFTYNADIWDINKRALDGTPGVYTHVSYRPDKSDCHPQPELISMLQAL